MLYLTVFPEVVQTQVGRRLVLPLVLDAGDDEHQDCHHVWCHGYKLFCSRAEARYQDAADVEAAEAE